MPAWLGLLYIYLKKFVSLMMVKWPLTCVSMVLFFHLSLSLFSISLSFILCYNVNFVFGERILDVLLIEEVLERRILKI